MRALPAALKNDERPLFIPLKGKFFDLFVGGSKDTEYRLYGARWNERTCREGRAVILSRGYGKRHRLRGVIEAFWTDCIDAVPGFRECYPRATHWNVAACIKIKVKQ